MATFFVRHSMNPSKAVTFGITYKQLIDKNSSDGELIWLLEIATDELDKDTNGIIPPRFINLINFEDMDEVIEDAISELAKRIDWGELASDTRAPFVDSVIPSAYTARIHDNVIFRVKDLQPSVGIDINSIQMLINDVDVSSDLRISGDEFEYQIEWRPPSRIYTQIIN